MDREFVKRCTFVIGRQRTGTTVLRRMLCSQSDVADLGEIMHPDYGAGFYMHVHRAMSEKMASGIHEEWPKIMIDTIKELAKTRNPMAHFVIDVKYNMALSLGMTVSTFGIEPVFVKMLKDYGFKVIHLIRKNKLELLTSEAMAIKTGKWEQRKGDVAPETAKVWLDPFLLSGNIAAEHALDLQFSNWLAQIHQKEALSYEDLFQHDGTFKQEVSRRMAHLIGVSENFDLTPKIIKQGRKLSDSVENFSEIQKAIRALVTGKQLPPYYLESL